MKLDAKKADLIEKVLSLTPDQLRRGLELMKQDPDLAGLFKNDEQSTTS